MTALAAARPARQAPPGPAWTPVPTPALYAVRIGHRRAAPLRNDFEYGGYLWLVDLADVVAGRLTRGGRLPRPLRGQVRFEARDHLGSPDRSILANVVEFARLHGVPDVSRVLMLANARTGLGSRLSYAFNPLTVHYCYRADGSLACLVAEVHNTHGERHAYLLHPDDAGRAEATKDFYVSPFLAVGGRYDMRFSAPGERLQISIALRQGGRTPFTAWLRGAARPATARTVAIATLRHPVMALRVSALIRIQGVKLWLRRLPVLPWTPHHPPAGVIDSSADCASAAPRESRTGS